MLQTVARIQGMLKRGYFNNILYANGPGCFAKSKDSNQPFYLVIISLSYQRHVGPVQKTDDAVLGGFRKVGF